MKNSIILFILLNYDNRYCVFAFFIDTNSKITNFSAPKLQDSSNRMANEPKQAKEIFNPFIYLANIDINDGDHFHNQNLFDWVINPLNIRKLLELGRYYFNIQFLLLIRPLWNSTSHANDRELVLFACYKILNSESFKNIRDESEKLTACIATISCRIPVNIHPKQARIEFKFFLY